MLRSVFSSLLEIHGIHKYKHMQVLSKYFEMLYRQTFFYVVSFNCEMYAVFTIITSSLSDADVAHSSLALFAFFAFFAL